MIDEAEESQSVESAIDGVGSEAEERGHPTASVEGGAVPVGGKREEDEDGGRVGSEFAEPALVQEPRVEPAESARWAAQKIGPGRGGPHPELALAVFAALRAARRRLRSAAFCASRSWASFSRYDSPSMSTTSDRWMRRSTAPADPRTSRPSGLGEILRELLPPTPEGEKGP